MQSSALNFSRADQMILDIETKVNLVQNAQQGFNHSATKVLQGEELKSTHIYKTAEAFQKGDFNPLPGDPDFSDIVLPK